VPTAAAGGAAAAQVGGRPGGGGGLSSRRASLVVPAAPVAPPAGLPPAACSQQPRPLRLRPGAAGWLPFIAITVWPGPRPDAARPACGRQSRRSHPHPARSASLSPGPAPAGFSESVRPGPPANNLRASEAQVSPPFPGTARGSRVTVPVIATGNGAVTAARVTLTPPRWVRYHESKF
jgi:hypothetical protein